MSILNLDKQKKLGLIYIGIICTVLLIPVWYRFPGLNQRGMGDFSSFYSAGFLIFWPMLWTIVWWAITRFSGLGIIIKSKPLRYWLLLAGLMAIWVLLSWVWAYKRVSYPSVTISAAMPFIGGMLFAVVLASVRIPRDWIFKTLAFGLIWCSIMACLQVATQGSLGLRFLGEFQVDPAASGTVVVQADGIRWLRPYGLLPHPNMLAGFLSMGLIGTHAILLTRKSHTWWLFLAIFTLGFWTLLLTFSRSAWLGSAVGLFTVSILTMRIWWKSREKRVRMFLCAGVIACAIGLFFVLYQPFLAARAGINEESIEMRSTADRAVYNQIAVDAIKLSPIFGLGIGNFSWYAADYLAKTDFDLRGQPVHNIYLLAWSELGVIGLLIFMMLVLLALRIGIMQSVDKSRQLETDIPFYAGAVGIICALLIIGLFDHYIWTLIQFQVAIWGTMAVAIQPPPMKNSH